MFSIRIHRGPNGSVLAVCDEELLGKTFTEGKLRLHVSEAFYGGDTVEEGILIQHLQRASSINLVGGRVVSIAIREGLVDADRVLTVDGVMHAMVLR